MIFRYKLTISTKNNLDLKLGLINNNKSQKIYKVKVWKENYIFFKIFKAIRKI